MTTKQSLYWTGFYILCAMAFACFVYSTRGAVQSAEFLTVFSLEKLLSMDNLLVIFIIFGYFGIPKEEQGKALTYGLAGAVVFRTSIILSGVYVIEHLSWILYAFAIFLIYSGYKIITQEDEGFSPEESAIVTFIHRRAGKLGLFVSCIIAVELSDIMFAVDSIPASFGVTQNSFIILTANLFAVLGLRSLYHAVSNGIEIVEGIEKYIGIVLAMVGVNVFVSHFWMKIPEMYLMGSVFLVLCFGVVACKRKKEVKNGTAV